MKKPSEQKMILSFGLFVGFVCWAIGLYASYKAGHIKPILPMVGTYFLVGGVLYQPILKPIFKIWMKIALGLGWFNTNLILTLLYFFLFAPISWIQKFIHRDILKLQHPNQTSFWTPKTAATSKNSYFRQF